MEKVTDIVKEYKTKMIYGKCLDLAPLRKEHSEDIVVLRNQERNRYNLNQDYKLTKESQNAWFSQYIEREDDLYWCILRKDGQFIGTIRLYDIEGNTSSCRQGSFIIDKEYASEGPYALEAIILTLDFAFNKLGVTRVYHDDRCDNKVMNNLSKKFGFTFEKIIMVKDVEYNLYSIDEENYLKKRDKIQELIDYWVER